METNNKNKIKVLFLKITPIYLLFILIGIIPSYVLFIYLFHNVVYLKQQLYYWDVIPLAILSVVLGHWLVVSFKALIRRW
jgi:hypothetical protein